MAARLFGRGRGTPYRRLQTLKFLVTRDRAAVASFLRHPFPISLPFTARIGLVARYLRITNQVRAYHSQEQMLAVTTAILDRAGRAPVVVECGCAKGGSTAKLSLAARLAGGRLIACDSFRGIPPNDERHTDLKGRPMEFRAGAFRGRLREVQRTIAAFGAPEVVEYRKGWFADSLDDLPAPIDVALLDVDLLESTRTCLRAIAPKLAEDGVIFSQDGHLTAIATLLGEASFWRDEVGVEPPEIPGLGRDKFLAIRWTNR